MKLGNSVLDTRTCDVLSFYDTLYLGVCFGRGKLFPLDVW